MGKAIINYNNIEKISNIMDNNFKLIKSYNEDFTDLQDAISSEASSHSIDIGPIYDSLDQFSEACGKIEQTKTVLEVSVGSYGEAEGNGSKNISRIGSSGGGSGSKSGGGGGSSSSGSSKKNKDGKNNKGNKDNKKSAVQTPTATKAANSTPKSGSSGGSGSLSTPKLSSLSSLPYSSLKSTLPKTTTTSKSTYTPKSSSTYTPSYKSYDSDYGSSYSPSDSYKSSSYTPFSSSGSSYTPKSYTPSSYSPRSYTPSTYKNGTYGSSASSLARDTALGSALNGIGNKDKSDDDDDSLEILPDDARSLLSTSKFKAANRNPGDTDDANLALFGVAAAAAAAAAVAAAKHKKDKEKEKEKEEDNQIKVDDINQEVSDDVTIESKKVLDNFENDYLNNDLNSNEVFDAQRLEMEDDSSDSVEYQNLSDVSDALNNDLEILD